MGFSCWVQVGWSGVVVGGGVVVTVTVTTCLCAKKQQRICRRLRKRS